MFPDRMLSLMKEKNITRKQICTDLGIGINQIKYWEKNNNYPSADVLYRLADYLGVSLDALMEVNDTVNSPPMPVSDSSKEVSVFYKKLIALCTEKNTNPTAVCDTLGFDQSAVTRWKQGSIPRDITLKKIADYFGVSVDALTTDDKSIGSTTTVPTIETTVMWKNFVQLCNDKGVYPNRVCADLGYSRATATKWKQGSIPRSTTLKKIADYFGVSVDALTTDDKSNGSTTTVSAIGTTVMWKKFVQLCNDKGVYPNRVCADLGYSKTAATKWKQGAIPHKTTLKKLADYFGISEDHFLSDDNDVSPASVSVSSASSRLFALIDIMTEEELEDLEKYAAFLISRNRS